MYLVFLMCLVIVYNTVATRLSYLIQYLLVVQLLFDHGRFLCSVMYLIRLYHMRT